MDINSTNNKDEKTLETINNELYKVSNILYRGINGVIIIMLVLFGFITFLDLSQGGEWSGLGAGLSLIGLLFIAAPIILFCLGIKNTKKYLINDNKKYLTKAKIFDIIALIINIIYILFLYSDEFGMQAFALLLIVGYIILIIIPNIIHLLLCFNLKVKKWLLVLLFILIIPIIIFKLSIQSPEKIKVDYSALPTAIDFNDELIKRKILDESYYSDTDKEKNYHHIEKFFENNRTKFFERIQSGEEKQKYSMYRYEYKLNVRGMNFDWEIYSVNNKIYAYLDYIFEDTNMTNGAEDYMSSNGIVVSEEEKITTYNANLKYYSYGGGFMKNFKRGPEIKEVLYGRHITEISFMSLYMIDKYNSQCADIVVVDEINADTLIEITNKIADGNNY